MARRRRQQQDTIHIPWNWIATGLSVIILFWLLLSPPRWWTNIIRHVNLDDPVATGEWLVNEYDCRGCHYIGSYGGFVGPDLRGITKRLDDDTLYNWLRDPDAVRGPTSMPNYGLSNSEITAITAYLHDQDGTLP
jgi:cytochrome c2